MVCSRISITCKCKVRNCYLDGISSKKCRWYKEGDILEIILDFKARTLRFGVNGKDYDTGFDDIRAGPWRLALSVIDAAGTEIVLM